MVVCAFCSFCCLLLSTLKQVEGLTEQVGVEHPRKLISFTLTGDLTDTATLLGVVHRKSPLFSLNLTETFFPFRFARNGFKEGYVLQP